MPSLKLETILFNEEERDYSRNLEEILPLRQGDSIDVSFLLYGNGADLHTFMVKHDSKNINAIVRPSDPDQISEDFSDIPNGILGYKDNIRKTKVTVRLKVRTAQEEKSKISFYLNSKAPGSEGDMYSIDMATTEKPREVEKDSGKNID
jgi:hypothetical protein